MALDTIKQFLMSGDYVYINDFSSELQFDLLPGQLYLVSQNEDDDLDFTAISSIAGKSDAELQSRRYVSVDVDSGQVDLYSISASLKEIAEQLGLSVEDLLSIESNSYLEHRDIIADDGELYYLLKSQDRLELPSEEGEPVYSINLSGSDDVLSIDIADSEQDISEAILQAPLLNVDQVHVVEGDVVTKTFAAVEGSFEDLIRDFYSEEVAEDVSNVEFVHDQNSNVSYVDIFANVSVNNVLTNAVDLATVANEATHEGDVAVVDLESRPQIKQTIMMGDDSITSINGGYQWLLDDNYDDYGNYMYGDDITTDDLIPVSNYDNNLIDLSNITGAYIPGMMSVNDLGGYFNPYLGEENSVKDTYAQEIFADVALARQAYRSVHYNSRAMVQTGKFVSNNSPLMTKTTASMQPVVKNLPGAKFLGGPLVSFGMSATAIAVADDPYKEAVKQSVGLVGTLAAGAALVAVFGNPVTLTAFVGYSVVTYFAGKAVKEVADSSGFTDAYVQGLTELGEAVNGHVKKTDPLIIDFSGNGEIDLIGLDESSVLFDMDVDGKLQRTAWVSNEDGVLVFDKDGSGKIEDISEVFSEYFDPRANSALEALKLLDTNYNGKFDAGDDEFDNVQIWIDKNGNGVSEEGELKALSDEGIKITEINLESATVEIEDEHGNVTQAITSATQTEDGISEELKVEEVALVANNTEFTFDKSEGDLSYYLGDDESVLATNNSNAEQDLDLEESGIDAYIGGSSSDRIMTTGKTDVSIFGGSGNDTISGGAGDDMLFGGEGSDSISGGDGRDTLFIDSSDTNVDGGAGIDRVFITDESGMEFNASENNVEMVFGGDGDDVISTSSDEALISSGGKGNDSLTGASGDDILDGGEGDDYIDGGEGLDTAIFYGDSTDYVVTNNLDIDGTWVVTDKEANEYADYGTDILKNIERIRFNDKVIHADLSSENPSGTNNNPIFVHGGMTVRGNEDLYITAEEIMTTVVDIDGDYLEISNVGNVKGGSVSIDQEGNIMFSPEEGFIGKALFEYTVDDGHGGVTTGTVEVNVLPGNPLDELFEDQWYIDATNINEVWDDYTGKGVSVGVLDDGLEAHADIDGGAEPTVVKLSYEEGVTDTPFLGNDTNTGEDGTHGTFLAGLIAADRNDEGSDDGIVGVAYDADVTGYIAYGEKAFTDQEYVDISTNSWMFTAGSAPTIYSGERYGYITEELESAVENGRDGLGTIVFSTAGNERRAGENTNNFELMNSRYAITIGAADSLGKVLPFSTPGANVHVVAPGSDITSTDREGEGGYATSAGNSTLGLDYFNGQGTSFSTPIVAGIAALLLEANPDLGWRDVKEILAYSAINSDPLHSSWRANSAANWNGGGLLYSNDYGFGMVDALAAVRLAETWGKDAATSANELSVSGENSSSQTVPNDEDGIVSAIEIESGVTIDTVEVELDMLDTDLSDLQVTLISPDGTQSVLLDGVSQEGSGTVTWTLSSGHFIGENGVGTWYLQVIDKESGDKAVLNSWKLNLYGDEISDDDVYVYTNSYANFVEEAYETRGVIEDNEGIDTINASAVTTGTLIDLENREGEIVGREIFIQEDTLIENVFTGDGDDEIIGNELSNHIVSGRGDDTIVGGSGRDILDGGEGNDIADYSDSDAAININLSEKETSGGHADGDSLINIEGIIGSEYNDTLIGDDKDNVLTGEDGNDNISAGDGNDHIVGGSGDDDLSGGAGDDTIYAGIDNDSVDGGDDFDTVIFEGQQSDYTIAADFSSVTHNDTGDVTTLSNVERLRFTDGDVAVGSNTVPTISTSITLDANEDEALSIAASTFVDSVVDADTGDSLSLIAVGTSEDGVVGIDAEGNVTFTPSENFAGSTTFDYTVSDGNGGTVTGTANVTVAEVNDAPEAKKSAASTPMDSSGTSVISGTLSAEDIDNDYAELSFALDDTAGPKNGSVSIDSTTGEYTYTSTNGFVGSDSFTFTVTDPSGESSSDTVYIEVKGEATVSTTFQLNANPRYVGLTTINDVVQPTVTTLSTGGFVAAWKASLEGDDGYEIYARRFDAGGNPSGEEFLVNTTTEDNQEMPNIVAMNDGGFIVSWTSMNQDGSLEGIYAQRYDANGNPISEETQINTSSYSVQKLPVTVGLTDGSFVVVWQSLPNDPGNIEDHYNIYAKKYNSNGTVSREEFKVNEYDPDVQDLAQVKATPDGGFIVVWESLEQDGDNYGVYGQRYDMFSNKVGDEFRINDGVDGGQGRPDITVLNDGSFVVTWQDGDQEPSPDQSDNFDITLRHFDEDGDAISDEIRVNNDDFEGLQQYATVTALSHGGYVVVWESHTGDYDQLSGEYTEGSSGAIYAQVYDKYSKELGDMVTIETFDSSYSWRPEVTAQVNGGYVVVWQNATDEGEVNMYSKIVDSMIDTSFASMYLVGTEGDDSHTAGDADDYLYGAAGDDALDGGAGDDTAVYWKTRDEYSIKQNEDGSWTVTNLEDGLEGTDTLRNIEYIQFADQLLGIGTDRASNNDTIELKEDDIIIIDPGLASDTDPDSVSLGDPSNGIVVLNDDLTITYVPNENYNGDDAFTITVDDETQSITLSVLSQNDAPVLSVDSVEVDVNGTVSIDVLGGASDVDTNDSLSINDFGKAQHGTVELIDGKLQYTPDEGFRGYDEFEYDIIDSQGEITSETVVVNVGNAELVVDLGEQQYNINESFDFSFTEDDFISTFADVYHDGDTSAVSTLSYSVTLGDGGELPGWLSFNAESLTFSGTADMESVYGFDVVITATDGVNSIESTLSFSSNAILGDTGKDHLEGDSDNNVLVGDTGNDTLEGQAGDDYLDGGDDDDTLSGGEGDDTLSGSQGQDVLKGGAGDDVIDGGNGIDEVNYEDESYGVRVDLEKGYAVGASAGEDTITHVENVQGSMHSDVIIGNDADNNLFGGHGDDVIRGGEGDDILFSDEGEDELYGEAGDDILLGSDGAEIIDGGEGVDHLNYSHIYNQGGVFVDLEKGEGYIGVSEGDTYSNIENVTGTNSDDVIIGDSGDNQIAGLEGNDILKGGAGDDVLYGGGGLDRLIGGDGNDRFMIPANPNTRTEILDFDLNSDKIDYSLLDINMEGGVLSLYKNDGDTFIHLNSQYIVIIKNVVPDDLTMSHFIFSESSTITGIQSVNDFDNSVESIVGDAENNRLYGHMFNDIIYGGAGDDTISAMEGEDEIYGEAGNDTIQGNSDSDIIDGGAGEDDAVDYLNSHDSVTVNLSDGLSESGGSAEGDVLKNIENVYGSRFGDSITGDNNDNYLLGSYGDDILTTVGGTDILEGGEGSDTFVIHHITDGVTSIKDFDINNPNEKIDLSDFGAISMVDVIGYDGYIVIKVDDHAIALEDISWGYLDKFEDGSMFIFADAANPTIRTQNQAFGTSEDNIILGTNQDDVIAGTGNAAQFFMDGKGNDTIYANATDGTLYLDEIRITRNPGDEDVIADFDGYMITTYERYTYPGLTINNGDPFQISSVYTGKIIDLSEFSNIRDVSDLSVVSSGGNLIIDLGDGQKLTLYQFDYGESFYTVYDEFLEERDMLGLDGVKVYETVQYTRNLAVDTFKFYDGTLSGSYADDTLNGDYGADEIYGYDGDDAIDAGAAADTVDAGSGNDTVYAGSGDDNVSAGSGDDIIYGENGDDTIDAGSGDDTIYGGKHSNTMTGGEGQDTFVITKDSNETDTITDFEYWRNEEKIDLSDFDTVFTNFSDLRANMSQVDNDTHIDLENSQTLVLENVVAEHLTKDDFIGNASKNSAPTVTGTIDAGTDDVDANATWTFSISDDVFTDSDGDRLDISATLSDGSDLPDWMTFDSDTLSFSGMPGLEGIGTYEIKVTASDGSESVSTTFSITVDASLTATNLNQTIEYTEDTAYELNDIVISSASSTVTVALSLSNAEAGTINTGASGDVTSTFVDGVWTASGPINDVNVLLADLIFTPTSNFNKDFSITATVSDESAVTLYETMAVTGIAVNDAPEATAYSIEVDAVEDTALAIDPTDITDVEDGSISLTADNVNFSNVSDGVMVSVNEDGTIQYEPAAETSGVDTFTYTVSDSDGKESEAITVTVNVAAVNDDPTADNVSAEINEDAMYEITEAELIAQSGVSDVDDESFSVSEVKSASNGTVVLTDGLITFTPTEHHFGEASFEFTLENESGQTITKTLTLNVVSVNDQPVITVVSDTTNEDESVTITVPVANDIEDGEIAPTESNVTVYADNSEATIVVNSDGSISYTPTANFNGVDSFSYTITDSEGFESEKQTVTVTVNAVNDAPTATDVSDEINEDTVYEITEAELISQSSANDIDGDSFTVLAVNSAVNGTVLFEDGVISFVPESNYFGEANFEFTLINDSGETISNKVILDVTSVNDEPTALYVSTTLVNENEEGAEIGEVTVDDIDENDTHTYTVDDDRFEIVDQTLKLKDDVALDFEESETVDINITVTDAAGDQFSKTFTVTVIDGVDVIEGTDLDDFLTGTAGEDIINAYAGDDTINPGKGSDVISTGSGIDTITLLKDPGSTDSVKDFDVASDIIELSDFDDRFSNFSDLLAVSTNDGSDTIIDLGDGQSLVLEGVALEDLSINNVIGNVSNAVPEAGLSEVTADVNEVTIIDVLAQATDANGDDISLDAAFTDNPNVTLEIVDGKIQYTPETDFEGTDTFSYTLSDSNGASITQTVTVTVEQINDAPHDLNIDVNSVDEDEFGAIVGPVVVGDVDIGDTHTFTVDDHRFEVVDGQLKLKDDESLNYETASTLSITVTAEDSGGETISKTVDISVNDVIETITGTDQGDNLVGESGAEIMYGLAGDDNIQANGGDDVIQGGEGADTIDGGTGFDTVDYSDSSEAIFVDLDHDTDFAHYTLDDPDVNTGGSADGDVLSNVEAVIGSDHKDYIEGDENDNLIKGGAEYDYLSGAQGDDTIYGGDATDRLFGGQDNDSLYGEDGDDYIYGGSGEDYIEGGEGDDFIDAGSGSDRISSGAGKDVIDIVKYSNTEDVINDFDVLNDQLDLSAFDESIIDFEDALRLMSDDNSNTTIQLSDTQTVVLEGVLVSDLRASNFIGNASIGNKPPTAINVDNTILDENEEGAIIGNVTVDDEDEDDAHTFSIDDDRFEIINGILKLKEGTSINYEDESSITLTITVTDTAGESMTETVMLTVNDVIDVITGTNSKETLKGDSGIDHIDGGKGGDKVFGYEGNDELYGGDGWDKLYGGAGADYLDGGSGNDQAIYVNSDAGVTINLTNNDDNEGGDAQGDELHNIEYIQGSQYEDRLTGDENSNKIWGKKGDDYIEGGSGDDYLYGNGGKDEIHGGEGNDTIKGSGGNDIIYGGEGNDIIEAGASWDVIWGGAGADEIDGGNGTDWLYYDDSDQNVHVDLSGETLGSGGTAEGDQISNVERLSGSAYDDSLLGSDADNYIYGQDGDDDISGRDGDDRLKGDGGNDSLSGDAGDDTIYGGDGDDSLIGGDGDDSLYGNLNNDTLTGSAGADLISTGGGKDVIIYELLSDSTSSSYDTVTDFSVNNDVFNFEALSAFGIDGMDKLNIRDEGSETIVESIVEDHDFEIHLDGSKDLSEDNFIFSDFT